MQAKKTKRAICTARFFFFPSLQHERIDTNGFFLIEYSVLESVCKNEIVQIKRGAGAPLVLVVGAVHAREWVTMLLVEELARAYSGADGVLFVPCANPDGVALARFGATATFPTKEANAVFLSKLPFLEKVNRGTDFSLWKANANAVDINVNFAADWGTGKQNVRRPSPANYVGTMPASEPETRALTVLSSGVPVVLSYHTKGNVIYHSYKNADQTELALPFSRATGYPLSKSEGSAGGLKDYVVKNGGFGLTIEVGDDNAPHPLDERYLPEMIKRNREVVDLAVETAAQLSRLQLQRQAQDG